jgi:L-alanine-DL-glutamate epimerase-like enolase superfamily enzyme
LDELKLGAWQLDRDGMLAIPSAPGLGIEIDTDAVQRYSGAEVQFAT